MILSAVAFAFLAALQQPAAAPKPDLPTVDAALGPCAADFTVADAAGKPVFSAAVKVRIRYGFMSLKRMDLEVATNPEGKARVQGLPSAAKPLAYTVTKGETKAAAEQNVATTCQAAYSVALK